MISAQQLSALDRAFSAIQAARKHARKKLGSGSPGTGTLICPACGHGTLTYTVVAPLGRLNGRCSTERCVSWTNQ